MAERTVRIGEKLREEGLITEGQLTQALETQEQEGGKLVQILLRNGALTREDFVSFLSKKGYPSLYLSSYDIDHKIASLIPLELAKEKEIFCLDRMGSSLTLGMACVLDQAAIDEVALLTGLKVKPILCEPEDIAAAIARYEERERRHREAQDVYTPEYDIRSLLTPLKLEGLALLVREIESLPMLPDTVRYLEKAMASSSTDARDIAEIIERDPPLAAKLLSFANSAAYPVNRRISSVREAVALAGFANIRMIVSAAATLEMLSHLVREEYQAFQARAYRAARLCSAAAQQLRYPDAEQYFVAGLLYGIGKLVLMRIAPELWKSVDADLSGMERVAAENEAIGLNHAEAGHLLAVHWGLPEFVQEAARFHHQFAQAAEHRKIVSVVSMVDKLISVEQRALREVREELEALDAGSDLIQALFKHTSALSTEGELG